MKSPSEMRADAHRMLTVVQGFTPTDGGLYIGTHYNARITDEMFDFGPDGYVIEYFRPELDPAIAA